MVLPAAEWWVWWGGGRLVDLLNYEERAILAKERDAFDENGQRLFLEYVEQSYRLFLEGEARDADARLLDEQLAQQFEVSPNAKQRRASKRQRPRSHGTAACLIFSLFCVLLWLATL